MLPSNSVECETYCLAGVLPSNSVECETYCLAGWVSERCCLATRVSEGRTAWQVGCVRGVLPSCSGAWGAGGMVLRVYQYQLLLLRGYR